MAQNHYCYPDPNISSLCTEEAGHSVNYDTKPLEHHCYPDPNFSSLFTEEAGHSVNYESKLYCAPPPLTCK